MNGDLLTTLDYRALFEAHTEKGAWGTIAVSRRELALDYGVVRASPTGDLEDFVEKPVMRYEISMGISVLSRRCLDFIPRGTRFDMPELMLAMRDAGNRVMCYPASCYWQDIGCLPELRQASADFVADPGRFLGSGEEAG